MKQLIVALAVVIFASSAAWAQLAPAAPDAPVAIPAHKKAAPAPKHKKAFVKKDRTKKIASF